MSSRTMKAAMLHGPGDIRIEQVPMGEPGPDEVLVRIAYCGICPSDFRVYDGRSPRATFPMIGGHEFSGWIEAKGSNVKRVEVGDPVAVNPAKPCYTACAPCGHGVNNKCTTYHSHGLRGFAEYCVVPDSHLYPLKPTTSLAAASFGEPLACVLHGQHRAHVRMGTTTLIVGSGPIGLLHLLSAKAAGSKVIVSEPHATRLAAAVKFGADLGVNPAEQDLVEVVKKATQGWGADSVIVCVGNSKAAESAIMSAAPQAHVVLFAGTHPETPISLSPNFVHYQEINLTGSSDYIEPEYFESIQAIEQKTVDVASLIEHVLPLDQLKEGMEIVRTGTSLKVVMEINKQRP